MVVYSVTGVPIRLTRERWHHVRSGHPELTTQYERILETLGSPEVVLRGDRGELLAARFYSRTPVTSKYLVTVYRELGSDDGSVITAYFTNALRQREVVWTP